MADCSYTAKDLMSKYVLTVPPEVTVQDLVKLFVSHSLSAVPVTGEDNELLGIISEGDLLYKEVRPYIPQYINILGASLYYCGYGKYKESFQKLLAVKAEEIMTRQVRCVLPDTPINDIAALMIDEHLKTVPVVDEKHRLLGVITRHDMLAASLVISHMEGQQEEKDGQEGKTK